MRTTNIVFNAILLLSSVIVAYPIGPEDTGSVQRRARDGCENRRTITLPFGDGKEETYSVCLPATAI